MNKLDRHAVGKLILHCLIALSLLPVAVVATSAPAHAVTAVKAAPNPLWSDWAAYPTEYFTREQATRAMRAAHQYIGDKIAEQGLELRVGDVMVEVGTALLLRFRIEWRMRIA